MTEPTNEIWKDAYDYTKGTSPQEQKLEEQFPTLTVGELKKKLEGVPDDAIIVPQSLSEITLDASMNPREGQFYYKARLRGPVMFTNDGKEVFVNCY